jgi:hypothetical protein
VVAKDVYECVCVRKFFSKLVERGRVPYLRGAMKSSAYLRGAMKSSLPYFIADVDIRIGVNQYLSQLGEPLGQQRV